RHALADQGGAEAPQAHRLGFLQGRKVQSAGDRGKSLEQEALTLPTSSADHAEQRATDRVRREGGQAVPLTVPVEHAIRLRHHAASAASSSEQLQKYSFENYDFASF